MAGYGYGRAGARRRRMARLLAGASPGGQTLVAPTLSLGAAGNVYPPDIRASLPVEWQAGVTSIRVQSCADTTFVTTPINQLVAITDTMLLSDPAPLSVPGVSSITSPAVTFFRARGEEGAYYSAWSNIAKHGDVTAPTITSSASPSVAENTVNPTGTLTANEPVTWSIVGGADAALFTVNASTGVWTLNATPDYETKTSYVVTFRATDLAALTTDQTLTLSIIDQDEIPNAFTFTDITGGTRSTLYTSNTVTISGLGAGVTVPVTVTGGSYSKNSGAYTSAPGTAVNGDTFSLQLTSSSSYFTATNAVLTVGAGSDTYTVTTLADPSSVAVWNGTAPAIRNVTDLGHNTETFANQYFEAGTAIIAVVSDNRTTSGVTVGGNAATQIASIGNDTVNAMSVWQIDIASAGNYDVVCTVTAFRYRSIGIMFDVLTNLTTTNTGVATLAPGFRSDPQAVSSLTCSGTGMILAYAFGYDETKVPSWNVGTQVRAPTLAGVRFAMTSAYRIGTAAMSVNYGNYGGMIAISWEH